MRKHTTSINEKARHVLDISRDEYALCDYVQFRLADPRAKSGGWCSDTKQEIADFVGISRPGLYKMLDKMERLRLLEIDAITGFARVTGKWIDSVSECKQSLQAGVNKVYSECKQSLQGSVNKVTRIKEEKEKREIEKEQQEEVAAAEFLVKSTTDFEGVTMVELQTLEAEKKESPKVPLKGSFPPQPARRWDAFDIDQAAQEFKRNQFSAENFARITGTPAAQMLDRFTEEVDAFVLEQKAKQTKYNRFDEFSSHFFNYARAKVRAGRNNQAQAPQQAPPANFKTSTRY
jgi:hypothetical protein